MKQSVEIRPVGPDQIEVLASIDPLTAGDPRRKAHLAKLLEAGLSWIALDEGKPTGFAIVSRNFFNFPFVDLLHVAERTRRGGIGTALMDRCEAAHDSDRIFTSTNESNAPMRALLAKAGWRPCGQVDALDPGDPELFFVKFSGRG